MKFSTREMRSENVSRDRHILWSHRDRTTIDEPVTCSVMIIHNNVIAIYIGELISCFFVKLRIYLSKIVRGEFLISTTRSPSFLWWPRGHLSLSAKIQFRFRIDEIRQGSKKQGTKLLAPSNNFILARARDEKNRRLWIFVFCFELIAKRHSDEYCARTFCWTAFVT